MWVQLDDYINTDFWVSPPKLLYTATPVACITEITAFLLAFKFIFSNIV